MRIPQTISCVFLLLMPFFTTLNAQNCGDEFFDSGGSDNNYQPNEQLVWTFCPSNEEEEIIELNFSHVDINSTDELNIYSENNLINSINFTLNSPFNVISESPDGCLTVEFISNQVLESAGWEATINCIPIPDCPRPNPVNVFNIEFNSAIVSSNVGDALNWDVEYGPSGFAHGEGFFATIIDFGIFSMENLMSGTHYDIYIRIHCPEGGFSAWSSPTRITTDYTCGDRFYDLGGPDENFRNNENITALFCSDNPDQVVRLDFKK